ncbi:rhomboid family intramembrane serine protease [Frigidibacter sp. RF13]|uniref:rhomboid family intramembrane serine protease n=1 Tax=Frigidibacter sp. RF13 TaxID=2997340 RepID=UPI0022721A86|nr:rhomboid family intramembrane serine protease [Frigidibacter sp. RF13]MCY1128064.1 rhomboid family intramembrane serine protease [Frigidibacter sp. RF13]
MLWLILILCLLPELAASASDFGLLPVRYLRLMLADRFAFWPAPPQWAAYPGQTVLIYLSYAFLHANPLHLLMNMLALFPLGRSPAARLGRWRFLALYLALAVAGGLGYALLQRDGQPMVGASGALFGLYALVLGWRFRLFADRRRAQRWMVRQLALIALLNGALTLAIPETIAWQAHLGGFLAGLVFAWVLPPQRPSLANIRS